MESTAQAFLKDLKAQATDPRRQRFTRLQPEKGLRLFESETPTPLKLISSKTLSTGVLELVCGPSESPGDATADEEKLLATQSS